MQKGTFSYNPNLYYKDSISWFRQFIILQDEVSLNSTETENDSFFQKNRIIQVKINKYELYKKSLFSSHLLHSSSTVPIEKPIINPCWVSWLIFICFFLVAFAQYNYYKRMLQVFRAFFANRLFSQISRDGGLFKERVSLFLFCSYLLGISLFIFNISSFYSDITLSCLMSFLIFLKILTGIILFYLIKIAIFNFCGIIFKSKKVTSDYVLNIYFYGQISSIVLLPIIIFTTYIHSETIIFMSAMLLTLLYVYRIFKGSVYTISYSKISIYYLFLYLCTLEILPLLIIAKILLF